MTTGNNPIHNKKGFFIMKRILAAILLVVLTLSTVVLLASCGPKPELDLEDAKENLEDAKYDVKYYDEDYGVGIEEYLSATNKDDRLYVTVYADAKLAKLAYKELQMEMKQNKEALKLELKKLEYMLDEYSKDIDEDAVEEDIKEIEEALEKYDEYVIGRSGNTVWHGTKTAIEDSKG